MRTFAIALIVLSASSSWAAGRVLVVPLEIDDARGPPALVELTPIYDALIARGVVVVGREEREGIDLPAVTELDNVRADAVRALLLEARAQMRELEVDRAGTALKKARALALRLKDPALHTELIGEILLERASLLLARGAEEAAVRDLQLLAVLDRERKALHPGLYPPALTNAYAAARATTLEAKVPFVVVARPEEATLFVDNVAVRSGIPTRLCAGLHWVTARAPGRETVTHQVEVVDGGAAATLNIFVPFANAQQKRRRALLEVVEHNDDPANFAALAELSGADAVFGVARGGGILWTRAGLLTTTARTPKARARFVDEHKDAKKVVIVPPKEPPPEETDEGALILWVTTGALGAVVLGTAAAVSLWYLVKPEVDYIVPRPVSITCCASN